MWQIASKAVVKANPSGKFYALALNYINKRHTNQVYIAQKGRLTTSELEGYTIVAFEFLNIFIVALSDEGHIFLLTLNGIKTWMSGKALLPNPDTKLSLSGLWPSVSSLSSENLVCLSEGQSVAILRLPHGYDSLYCLVDLLLVQATLFLGKHATELDLQFPKGQNDRSKKPYSFKGLLGNFGLSEPQQKMTLNEDRFLVGQEIILQDHLKGKSEPVKAFKCLDEALTLLMANEVFDKAKVRKYSKVILGKIFESLKSLNAYVWLDKVIAVLARLELSWAFVAFFIKLVNGATKIFVKIVKDGFELLTHVSKWTLTLERSLNIHPSWFNPSFQAIYKAAVAFRNVELIKILEQNHSEAIIVKSKANLRWKLNPMLAFYKGQYGKAIQSWQELALEGQNTEECLEKIIYCLFDQGCFQDMGFFISWSFDNFCPEVNKQNCNRA